jgi:small conductance mechanosensitive channel
MNKIEQLLGLDAGAVLKVLLSCSINLLVAIVILITGFWLAKFLARTAERIMLKGNTEKSLIGFIRSLISGVIKVLVIVTAITQLGVEMTSFVAILGAAGLAIGLAFSGTLSNFAGGVMILLFKPFKSGDLVKMQGEEGVVDEVQIFNTYLRTFDNKIIILPNGPVANGNIVNYTRADVRRVDWTFGISYGDDLKVAKEILSRLVKEDERILKDPETIIAVASLGDSSVNIALKAWVNTEDYWPVLFLMNERVYIEFGNSELTIPFPQMDVHTNK